MRYHYNPTSENSASYGVLYFCDHPVYNRCTLFKIEDKGLAVIQQRYLERSKYTRWTEVDRALANDIYLNPGFLWLFENRAGRPKNDIYPTMTVRQVMWALRMKPLPKQSWETVFDHRAI